MNNYPLIIIFTVMFVSGCASSQPDMYRWGPYEDSLFAVYHEPQFKEEVLHEYMMFIQKDKGERPIAPGLFAEAGTFMLNQGDVKSAIKYYRMELERWPASQPMLTTLINNLEERN